MARPRAAPRRPPPLVPRTWAVTYAAQPWTANAEHRMYHMERARHVAEWRQAFAVLARSAHLPKLDRARIIVCPIQQRGRLADHGAYWPPAKAAIDGLVDAHVLDDDDPLHVVEVVWRAPARGPWALRLVVEEVVGDDPGREYAA